MKLRALWKLETKMAECWESSPDGEINRNWVNVSGSWRECRGDFCHVGIHRKTSLSNLTQTNKLKRFHLEMGKTQSVIYCKCLSCCYIFWKWFLETKLFWKVLCNVEALAAVICISVEGNWFRASGEVAVISAGEKNPPAPDINL